MADEKNDRPFEERVLQTRMRKGRGRWFQMFVRTKDGSEVKMIARIVNDFKDFDDSKSDPF